MWLDAKAHTRTVNESKTVAVLDSLLQKAENTEKTNCSIPAAGARTEESIEGYGG